MRGKSLIFIYFFLITLGGALALYLPAAWGGSDRLRFIDALFTSTSAVCVTGLITVDTAQYTLFGKTVIMLLIQAGGLGIITFATLLLLLPGQRMSFNNRNLIKNFYVEGVEYDPAAIIRSILMLTFGIELAGGLLLYTQFKDLPGGVFVAAFHTVSAFCNAGFSTFSTSLEGWSGNAVVLLTVPLLIISGGISFVVIHDIYDRLAHAKRKISLHTSVVLLTTIVLILGAGLYFYFGERNGALSEFEPLYKILNAFFHAVTPRTAGFNTLAMDQFSARSHTVTALLMFIGGTPGSMAGGIKVTTLFLVLLAIFRGVDAAGDSIYNRHRISARSLTHAGMFMLKALFLLAVAIVLLTVSEARTMQQGAVTVFDLIFETVSAFGTVGLSLGATSLLSPAGKIIIIITMLSGRLGLVFLASDVVKRSADRLVEYPHGEVLTG